MPDTPRTGNVRVAVRFRPEPGPCAWTLNIPARTVHSLAAEDKKFTFQNVLPQSTTNAEVYDKVVSGVVENWLSGCNGTIFAYGQTNSGKTHTMFGHQGGEVGVIRAVVRRLFQYVDDKRDHHGWNCACTVSFCEIYNENARDLLSEGDSTTLPVRESPDVGAFYLDGISEMPVYSEDECMRTLQRGAQAKVLGYSHLNDVSSRSHTIFRLSLAIETPAGEMSISELNLVDLAGAESLSYEFGHAQQTETKTINLSLLMLKSVISALANKDAFVPYRRSLLTKLLQNALGGNSLTAMICCVSPSLDNEGMTKRTLAFGQIARQVTNNLVRNIYAADGKRLLKMRDDVEEIEINARAGLPKAGKRKGGKRIPVSTQQGIMKTRVPLSPDDADVDVDGDGRFVNCHVLGPDNGQLALVLHGFGKTSSGLDWQYILAPLAQLGYRVVAPDMPGFGDSPGSRQSSRTEKFNESGEVTSTLLAILAHFRVTNSKGQLRKGEPPAIALGYDWGAAMALHLAAHKPRALSRVVAFHPSWTADLALLNQVKTKSLLLWVPVEQLHPIAMGKRMSRALPNASLVKVDCGNFTKDKPKGTYDCIAPTVIEVISKWLSMALPSPSRTPMEEEDVDPQVRRQQGVSRLQSMLKDPAARGLASGSRAHVDKVKEREEARQAIYTVSATPPASANTDASLIQWAVTRFRELCFTGEINEYFKAYQTNTPLKPTVVRLFSALPIITPASTIQDMHTWGVWPTMPRGHELLDNFPRYLPGRQVLVVAPVHGEIDAGDEEGYENYGCYKQGGRSSRQVTHRASILRHEMDKDGKLVYIVAIDNPAPHDGYSEFQVSAKDMYHLNEPTNFAGDPLKDGLLFEDGVRCKYGDLLTKAKVMQAALAVAPCVAQMDFEHSFEHSIQSSGGDEDEDEGTGCGRFFGQGPGAEALLQCQKRIITRIRRTFDCIHFDYEPMEAARSSRPEVGQLALYGQGNCHTMASVMAALLLPFASVGIQVRYRAGFVSKLGRDLVKDNLQPVESWDRRPRPIDDHTWLEVTLLPSLQSYVCDPSSHELCVPLDHAYSRWGRRHPSAALQCGSLKIPSPPVAVLPADRKQVWRVREVERLYWPARTSCRQDKPRQVKWSQIASEFAELQLGT